MLAGVAPAPRVAGRLAAERSRDLDDEGAGAVQEEAAPRPMLAFLRQRLEDPALCLRPHARHVGEPTGGGRLAELRRGRDAQRPPELHRTLRREPDEAA